MNIHPGALAALKKLNGNELDIARLMASGDLVSPQHYINLWMFCLRITGTGVALRPQHNEFVVRQEDDYLTSDFLARIGGLPVIMYHPPKNILDSDEYSKRVIGAVMLPYIDGGDVWAVCRVHDDGAAELMQSEQLSTSPGVVIGKDSVKRTLDGESQVLFEVNPKLVDHIAICEHGVWDKGGEPAGILSINARGDSIVMAEETKKEGEKADAARMDAEKRMDEKLDLMMKGIGDAMAKVDAACAKMDAWERDDKARKDAEVSEDREKHEEKERVDKKRKDSSGEEDKDEPKRLAADRARKDESEREKDKEKEKGDTDKEEEKRDDSRADAISIMQRQLNDQKALIQALSTQIPRSVSDAEWSTLTQIQARADDALIPLGLRAPRAFNGETPLDFKRRCADMLRPYSPRWKDIPVRSLTTEAFEKVAEEQIYADAAVSARAPSDIAGGGMRAVVKTTPSGHTITEFVGKNHFTKQFARPCRRGHINTPQQIAGR